MTRRLKLLIICLLVSVFLGALSSSNTFASDGSSIIKKWIFTQYYQCVRDSINSPIEQKKRGEVAKDVFPKSGSLALPSYQFQHSVGSGSVNCYNLFLGVNGLNSSVLAYAGKNGVKWDDPSSATSFLESLGYTLEETGGQTFNITAKERTCITTWTLLGGTSDPSCYDSEESSIMITATKESDGLIHYKASGSNFLETIKIYIRNHNMELEIPGNILSGCTEMYDNQKAIIPLKSDVQEFYADVDNILGNKTWGLRCTQAAEIGYSSTSDSYYSFVVGDIVSSSDTGSFVYAKDGNSYDVSNQAIKGMSGMTIPELALNDSELYDLYYYYLEKALPEVVQNRLTREPTSTNGLTEVRLKAPDGTFSTYYANFNGQDLNSIVVYTQTIDYRYRQPYPTITTITMQQIIDWFNSVDEDKLADVQTARDSGPGGSTSGGGTTGGDDEGDPCYNSGIEGMSWVLCPTINNTAEAVDGIDGLLDSWLAVDADLYKGGSDAYKAWSSFRTIANVFMIIVLLAIIVSQITGYGIDNYGIKKMLPRLIIMSILINLSFVICEIAIDISNILGSGLNELFKGLGHSISSGFSPGKMISGLVAGLFGALAGAGAVSGVAISVIGIAAGGGGVMLVLSLVIALITALVAVLMFFISLGARFIIIIVFTALAPVAFACYVLPNTQGLFKKWWDIFKTALLVYPICGALYGMSFVVRGIVFGGGELHFWMAIMAIIAPFLPFLLLPGLIKGALSTLGRLGGTLAMVGAGVKRGISKGNTALQGTDAYKSQQEMAQRNLNARRAGLKWDRKTRSLAKDENGNYIQNENIGRLGRFVRGGDSGMAAARSRFLRDEKAKIDEQNLMGAGFAAGLAGVAMRADEQRDANAEAMLAYDKATFADADGNTHTVNSGSIDSVAAYHAASLRKYNEATTDDERANALSEIRASQKMLSKTDTGRGMVNQNLTDAVIGGNESGARVAATHLNNNYGDVYKTKNRGSHKLISDLSGGTEMSKVQENIGNGTYELAGASKYDQSTLVGADELALKSMANAVSRIEAKRANGETVSESEQQQFDQIRNTARKAVEMYDSGRLSIKPEALEHVEKIAGQKAQRVSGGDSGTSDGDTDDSSSSGGGGSTSSSTSTSDSGGSEVRVDTPTASRSYSGSSETHSVNATSGGIRSDDYIDKRISSAHSSAPGAAVMRSRATEALSNDGVLSIAHNDNSGRGSSSVENSVFDTSRNQVTDSGIVIANEEQTRYFNSREAKNARPEAVKKDFSRIVREINQNRKNS
ncbi:hypothetical protein J6V85_02295 [Candidatus Saccharibacteria bacterium]|nr:hypothetical protein [Candidatus Saccharibacteria bacterium]